MGCLARVAEETLLDYVTRPKNILILSYWSLREPLTAAAVFPYMRILSERSDVGTIRLVTMETTKKFLPEVDLDIEKVTHTEIRSRKGISGGIAKAELFIRTVFVLIRMVRREKIDLVIAKASLAGAIADLVHFLTGVPYMVESYEPHATYMAECGVWERSSLRFRFAHWMEQRQLVHASHIITVTRNHRNDLIREGISPQKVHVVPSITDLEVFRFDPVERQRIRAELGIHEGSEVGIYVGKFGGLYFETEAFEIFKRAMDGMHDMHVLVLSPSDHEHIRQLAEEAGIRRDRFHVLTVKHVEVPHYLSASDMAFSTIKPSPAKRYQCPIKNGEYWANGLPILMTDGVADDHLLMRKGLGGAVYREDLADLDQALGNIRKILDQPGHRSMIQGLARRFRSSTIIQDVYEELFGPDAAGSASGG